MYNVLQNTPEKDPYTTLVDRIISNLSSTDAAQIKQLLTERKRGNKKPSLFLRELRELGKNKVTTIVLREIFYADLSTGMSEILPTTGVTDMDIAAQEADRTWERESANVSAIITGTNSNSNSIEVELAAIN